MASGLDAEGLVGFRFQGLRGHTGLDFPDLQLHGFALKHCLFGFWLKVNEGMSGLR